MVHLLGLGSDIAHLSLVAKETHAGSTKGVQYIVAKGCRCKVVRAYRYLGSVIHTAASMTPEITAR
eukprot:12901951-Prorocentrum_lima.AAC.1